jgi:hypothetical protein
MSDLVRFATAAVKVELSYDQVFGAYKKATIYLKDREITKISEVGMKALSATQSFFSKIMFGP